MTKKIFSYLLIIPLLIIISPLISFAQMPTMDSTGLEMSISPENPEPLQNVSVSLKSYSYDLSRSRITWYVNGVEKKTEIGLKDYSLKAGTNGQKMTIKVYVETPLDGGKEMEVFFIPSVVDLIYESLSYTPPFYKGRALNPYQGVVLVTAIPELVKSTGEKIPAQNIIYSWRRDGKAETSSSGIGKNTFFFSGTVPIRDTVIKVTASSIDGDIYASKQVSITNVEPKIIYYENSPVYGIMFNKGIKNTVKMLTDEFSVLAFPYYFSAGYATTPDLDYTWTLNGQTVGNQSPKNSFTVRQEGGGVGTASIGSKISNNIRIYQFGQNNYTINFEK
jgi:hypothetical protein